jgi:hypothetical protein
MTRHEATAASTPVTTQECVTINPRLGPISSATNLTWHETTRSPQAPVKSQLFWNLVAAHHLAATFPPAGVEPP